MEDKDIIHQLQNELPLSGSESISLSDLIKEWARQFNRLIENDFSALVSLLYRIDISESRLRYLLKENAGRDAGEIIAELVVQRLLQKIKTREEYRTKSDRAGSGKDAEEW
jgi:hypothetical protein